MRNVFVFFFNFLLGLAFFNSIPCHLQLARGASRRSRRTRRPEDTQWEPQAERPSLQPLAVAVHRWGSGEAQPWLGRKC